MNSTAELNFTNTAHYSVSLAGFLCFQALGIPFSILGILGNIISIYVWTRKRMHWGMSSTSCYLVALACSDMIYLLTVNIVVLLPNWMRFDKDHNLVPVFSSDLQPMRKIGQPIINVFSNISIYLVVAFTMERFIAVTFPMKGRVMCTPKRAKYIIAAIAITVPLLHIPDFLTLMPYMKNFEDSTFYEIGYNWGVMVLLFAVVPILLLLVFNTMLIRSVVLSGKSRREMTHNRLHAGHNRGHAVLTLTVIIIVVFFILIHTPAAIALCIYTYRAHVQLIVEQSEKNQWSLVFHSINFLTIFNYSLNFLAYSVTSLKFRQTTGELFGFKSARSPQTSGTTISRDNDATVNLSNEAIPDEFKNLYPNRVQL